MRVTIPSIRGRREGQSKESGNRTACQGSKHHGILSVDCHGCSKERDLTRIDCYKGVINLLASDPSGIREIVLASDWETRYDADCTANLLMLAEVIRFLSGIRTERRSEDCARCPSNPGTVATRTISTLPRLSPELREDFVASPGPHGNACGGCMISLSNDMEHARRLMARARSNLNRKVFKVVAGDGS